MTPPPRLDRLSALLAGLAPRVEVSLPQPGAGKLRIDAAGGRFLYLHLLAQGQVRLHIRDADSVVVAAPCIVVCRADIAHALEAPTVDGCRHLLCAKAYLDGPVADLLLSEFAEPRVVALAGAESSLRHVIELIADELLAPRCGHPALLDRAGDILFIGLLRQLIAHPSHPAGLLSGLSDPRIARALVAMHAAPQADWTLERLAEAAGMSRTSFATTFRSVMNRPPGKYLSAIRLAIAQRAVQSGKGLKAAARDAGYASASALSRALSRGVAEAKRAADGG
ncbi:MAG: AraC family transcriptional regulator [Rhodocyclales bacterium]|nr:AraC family transcriptional regulator [Rhodocyclales bacterium]